MSEDQQELPTLLAQPTAREILGILAEGESTVSTLAERVDLGVDTVSRYLVRFRHHGLVTYRSKHRWHIYRLTDRVRLRKNNTEEFIEVITATGEILLIGWKRAPPP